MRLAWNELNNIKNKILEDLYGEYEKDFVKRRIKIAQRNREYYLEPLKPIFDKLPPEMIPRHKGYSLSIKYRKIPNGPGHALSEIWSYNSTIPIINPQEPTQQYGQIAKSTGILDSRLYKDAAELCNEILAIQAEKADMEEYLKTSTKNHTGSLQLRKIWPESLHSYLPIEPVKLPKMRAEKKLKATKPAFSVPTVLKKRQTTNLLEKA